MNQDSTKYILRETNPFKEEYPSAGFPIVGIGASAGGLDALELFFKNMPIDHPMAFVVIQHLDPTHVAILPELLQRTTQMVVVQVTNRMKVEPSHVYVIPPNKSMTILKGHLFIFEPIEIRGLRLPINLFFQSLAEDQQEKSIGIVLSGMGTDGSLGLKAIKEKNGLILVQDPVSAKFKGMPQSAIKSDNIDYIGAADELPSKLIELLHQKTLNHQEHNIVETNISELEKIVLLLRLQTGHDFSLYKKNTLLRRIERRMNVHQIQQIPNYVQYLEKNPKEFEILFNELLIGVTNFFRDSPVWEKLKEIILPNFLNQLPNDHVLRAWVVGCSTGEEAYSLAILFKEVNEKRKRGKKTSIQIFATDIDSDAIDIARKGLFNSSILADVSDERINQYFTKEGELFRINTTIREMVVFAPHDVIKDPPFTKLDLISCRNLLIYLEPILQKRIMNIFHYCLNPGGMMLLGSSENENAQNNHFTPIDPKLKLYKSTSVATGSDLMGFPSSFLHKNTQQLEETKPTKTTENIQSMADQLLLQRFAPASILINQVGDIIYITGRTGLYLEPAAGKANMNIYDMARTGLRIELPGAIRKAKQSHDPVKLQNIKVDTNGGTQIVNITFQCLEKPASMKGLIIIVFYDQPTPTPTILKGLKNGEKDQITNNRGKELELEFELQSTREELQNTREEMQAAQEALKSANEEMQSTNEELQSTNEELTTSKEEMQSLNEELQTINAELQSKIVEYIASNNDMKNLLNSTDIATLFLDNELNIRRFTDQLTKLFKLRQTDIGRPFTDMVTDLNYPEMANHANEVLKSLVYKETSVSTHDGRWFTVRIMPYKTFDDCIDGLVITLIDITKSRQMEAELEKTIGVLREHNLLHDGS